MNRRFALAAHPLLSLLAALAIVLATRHHPIAHQRYVTEVVPAIFVMVSIAIAVALRRWRLSCGGVLAALDLLAWLPMVGVILVARNGAGSTLLWLGAAICAKAAVALVILGRAVVEQRLPDAAAGLALAAVAILFYTAPLPVDRLDRGLQLKGDEPHYLVTTISLLRDRDLFVEDEYAARVYTPFYDQTLTPHAVPARDGHLAPFHDAGLPILAAIPYAVGGWVAVLLGIAVVAGLTVREMFLLARAAGADPLAAFAASSLIGFTLPLAVYATQLYPEIPGALLTVFTARRLLMVRTPLRTSLMIGVALGALPWLQVRFWAIVLPLLVAALLTRRAVRLWLAVLVPVAAMTAGYVALNVAVYGRWTLSPFLFHESIGPQLGSLVAASGGPLAVLLDAVRPWLDPYDGPFWLSPVLLLAVIAVPLALRRRNPVTWLAITTIAVYGLLVGVHYLISTSGDSPPGRFMVAVIPLLVIPLAELLQPWARRGSLPAAVALGAGSAVMVVISIAEPLLSRYPYAGLGGPVAILGHRFHLPLDAILPSFPQPTASALLKSLVAVAVVGALAIVVWREAPPRLAGFSTTRPYNGSNADVPG